MMWGRLKENGIWLASKSRRRFILNRRFVFVALGPWRVRVMFP